MINTSNKFATWVIIYYLLINEYKANIPNTINSIRGNQYVMCTMDNYNL